MSIGLTFTPVYAVFGGDKPNPYVDFNRTSGFDIKSLRIELAELSQRAELVYSPRGPSLRLQPRKGRRMDRSQIIEIFNRLADRHPNWDLHTEDIWIEDEGEM